MTMTTSILRRFFAPSAKRSGGVGGVNPGPCTRYADMGTLSLVEVSDASAIAGALFTKAFNVDIPRFPRHFVMFRRTEAGTPLVLGYVHYTRNEDEYLAGGLVVAALEFRKLDAQTAALVRRAGGLAEWTMRTTCSWLECNAVFAYMGDAKSILVNTRVGFVATPHKYLYVMWKRRLTSEAQSELVARVAAIGPF